MLLRGFALAALLTLAACGGDGPAPSAETADTPAAEVGVSPTEIRMGSHTDLSGPIAIWGVGATNGARMRINEANAAGGVHGRQIRYIVEDTQYQVPQAIRAANKLIHRDKVFAILLAAGTPMNNAVMASQFKEGVPNLFPLTAARSMVTPFRKLMVTQMGIYYDEIRAAVRHFVEVEGKTTPCVIYQDTDYGQEIMDGARDQAAAMGIEIAATSAHKPTESEFTPAILKMRAAGCDLVLMGTVHRDTILVLETARKNGWEDVAWVGNEAAYGQVIADQESGSGEGYYAFVPIALVYEDDVLAPPVQRWFKRYKAEYDVTPGLPAMVGYRAADITIKALENAGPDITREGMIAAIEGMSEYTDLFGYTLTFGPEDHKGVDGSVLSQVQDGRWVTLGTSISY
jgi:branched-chain amino acid transport system substrate-binding protein